MSWLNGWRSNLGGAKSKRQRFPESAPVKPPSLKDFPISQANSEIQAENERLAVMMGWFLGRRDGSSF